MFRETNKEFLINNMMNNFSSDAKVVPLIPGEITFETIPVKNNTGMTQMYTVQIQDPDQNDEVRFVYSAAEYTYWYDMGKVNTKLPSNDTLRFDTVKLHDGESMDLDGVLSQGTNGNAHGASTQGPENNAHECPPNT